MRLENIAMNAIPTDFPGQRPRDAHNAAPNAAQNATMPGSHETGTAEPSPAAMQWAALREAAWAIATLAGPEAEAQAPIAIAFPARLHTLTGIRQQMALEAIGDLVAVMEVGLTAILAAHESGGRPQAAAKALWAEFVNARAGLLVLAPIPHD